MNESSNRAFMYGESVFTTMKMVNGCLFDWEYHFDRLSRGIEFLYGPFVEADWKMLLKNRLSLRLEAESGDKVLRLTVYREQARGLQPPPLIAQDDLRIHLAVSPMDMSKISDKSLSLRTCAATPRPHWWPSYLKAGNYLETILQQRRTLRSGDDDLLFLSPNDTVLETSIANIFMVRHNKLYTAPAGPNVLEGVMRRKILEQGGDFFDQCLETESTLDQLYRADAVFGCNSLRGLFLIGRIDDHELTVSQDVMNKIELLKQKVAP